MSMNSPADGVLQQKIRRLQWHSRRALLELDLVLERFWNRHGDTLTHDQAVQVERLLALEDHDLWNILSGRQPVGEEETMRELVDLILTNDGGKSWLMC